MSPFEARVPNTIRLRRRPTPPPTLLVTEIPLSNPAGSEPLRIVGQIGGPIRAVAVTDNYALVGVGPRLTVLDISSPEAICEMGSTQPFGAPVRGVVVSGNMAYVAAGESGLYVVDIFEPAQPVVTGNFDSPGYAEGVSVMGQVAYLADGPYGLRIIDVTDRAQPVEVAAVYELNYAFDVAVDAGYAYVAAAGAGGQDQDAHKVFFSMKASSKRKT